MSRTRAIIAGPFASSPFADGLRMFLADSGQFDTVEAADHSAVDDLIVSDRPVVIIGEGTDLGWALDLLDRGRARVGRPPQRRRPPGGDRRRRPQRAAPGAAHRGAGRAGRHGRRHTDGRTPAPRRPVRAPETGPPRPGDVPSADDLVDTDPIPSDPPPADLTPMVTWLELVLGARLLERVEQAGEPSFAGWTASPGDALAGLGLGDCSVGELRGRLAERGS